MNATSYNQQNTDLWSKLPTHVMLDSVNWQAFEDQVRKCQQANGLTVDGMLGPLTLAAMTQTTDDDPPWLKVALAEVGIKEISGAEDNPRIVEYHASTTLKATDDETPWCSSFVNWCMIQSGNQGTNSAWARSWLDWGIPEPIANPRRGAVAIFSRGETSGHVGFFLKQTDGLIDVLGGNQSDSVRVSRYPKLKLLGLRWPKTK